MIVFQHIVTVWSKRTRGAEDRELRARLPISYPLPDELLSSARRCVLHGIHREAFRAYAPTTRAEKYDRVRVHDAVTFVEEPGRLAVTFHGEACGRPHRLGATLTLTPGQRLTVRFNGRHQAYDDPWYEDHLLHVAFDARPTTGMFATPPDIMLDRRVDLW